jgi:hypothetical protein
MTTVSDTNNTKESEGGGGGYIVTNQWHVMKLPILYKEGKCKPGYPDNGKGICLKELSRYTSRNVSSILDIQLPTIHS